MLGYFVVIIIISWINLSALLLDHRWLLLIEPIIICLNTSFIRYDFHAILILRSEFLLSCLNHSRILNFQLISVLWKTVVNESKSRFVQFWCLCAVHLFNIGRYIVLFGLQLLPFVDFKVFIRWFDWRGAGGATELLRGLRC